MIFTTFIQNIFFLLLFKKYNELKYLVIYKISQKKNNLIKLQIWEH